MASDRPNEMCLPQAQMDYALRGLLLTVVSSDNTLRAEAERSLNQNFIKIRPEETILSLTRLMRQDNDFILRGLAAVLIRRVSLQPVPVQESTYDESANPMPLILSLSTAGCDSICSALLQALTSETTPNVRNKICDCVAEFARAFIESDRIFLNLVPFMAKCLQSPHHELREICHRILTTVPLILMPNGVLNSEFLTSAYSTCLSETENVSVRVAALNSAVRVILEALDARSPKSHIEFFEGLVVRMLNVLPPLLASGDEEHLEDSLTALIDLAVSLPTLFRPIAAHLFDFALPLISSLDIDGRSRYPALELVMTLVDEAPAMMRKRVPNLASHLIPVCLRMMADLEDSETASWEATEVIESERNCDSDENYIIGEQSLDRIARKIGQKKVTPVAFSILPAWISSSDWRQRHAALMAISAIAEGCSNMMLEMLPKIMDLIMQTMHDPHPRVRHALCNCIGQLCTDFSPGIQVSFNGPIITALTTAMQSEGHPRVQAHGAAAIINFCEGVRRRDLEIHLARIVQLLGGLCSHPKLYVRGQAITSLATVADAAEDLFAPYASAVFPLLFRVLELPAEPQFRELRGKALECATLVAMAIKVEALGDSGPLLLQALTVLQSRVTDPDDVMGTFLMHGWARLCEVFGREFLPYLPLIMPPLLQSAKVKPAVAVLDLEDNVDDYPVEQGWTHDEVRGHRICVRNSALEEKQNALDMLSCYARTLGTVFAEYAPAVMEIVVELVEFEFHEGVRHSAALIIPYLMQAVEMEKMDPQKCPPLTKHMWNRGCTALLGALEREDDSEVISTLFGVFSDLVTVSGGMITEEQVHMLQERCCAGLKTFYEIVKLREEARATDADYDPDDDSAIGEQEEIENNIPIEITKVNNALFRKFGERLLPLFESTLLPLVAEFLSDDDENLVFVAVNVFSDLLAYGMASGLKYLSIFGEKYLQQLSNIDESIRQTAAYGVGMAAAANNDSVADFCAAALPMLVQMIQSPKSKKAGYVLATENSVAAIGRILRHCPRAVGGEEQRNSLVQVFVLAQPIVFDASEAAESAILFCELIELGHTVVTSNILQVATSLIDLILRDVLRETGEMELSQRVTDNFSRITQSLGEDARSTLWTSLDPAKRDALSLRGLA